MDNILPKKNEKITLEIIDIAHDGNGVGKYQGMAVFVPHTAVGDCIVAKLVRINKTHAFGILEKIITPSIHRIDNDCPVFEKCGGCSLRHMSYTEELRMKKQWVLENMKRIGGISLDALEIKSCKQIEHYRNKAQLPIGFDFSGELVAGFYANRSHRIIPSTECKLQPPFFQEIIQIVLDYMKKNGILAYDEVTLTGTVRHVYIRYGEITGEIMVCIVATASELPNANQLISALLTYSPKIVSIVLNTNPHKTNVILGENCKILYGKEGITDNICNISVDISPLAFYQVNRTAAEKLYETAFSMAEFTGKERVVELYCGAGTISLSMASLVKEVIAVEIVPEAVENAKRNAEKNNIHNVKFICADAGSAAQMLVEEGTSCDIVVVDPPRKGCDSTVIDAITKMCPQKILYISCNSATLARDCKAFGVAGYELQNICCVDMFPRTCHIECVVKLCRVEK